MSSWFSKLQAVGKALMLPVAVLPAAALLPNASVKPLNLFMGI